MPERHEVRSNPAAGDHRHGVTDLLHVGQDMGRQDHRRVAREPTDQIEHLTSARGVESGARLVEDQHAGSPTRQAASPRRDQTGRESQALEPGATRCRARSTMPREKPPTPDAGPHRRTVGRSGLGVDPPRDDGVVARWLVPRAAPSHDEIGEHAEGERDEDDESPRPFGEHGRHLAPDPSHRDHPPPGRSLPAPASTFCRPAAPRADYAVSNARSMATEMRFQLRASASN